MITGENDIVSCVVFDSSHSWDNVFALCNGFITKDAQNRLKQLKLNSIIIEKEYIDKDYRNTFSLFHSKKFVTPKARCIRLHLFEENIDIKKPEPKNWQKSYLGYIVVRPTLPNSIGRTLLSVKIIQNKPCYLCTCEDRALILGVDLKIKGFPFISQDTDATVCAQSAMWIMLRFFSKRYQWYKEIYPSEITALIKAIPQSQTMPGTGLTMIQMADILQQRGFAPLIYVKNQYQDDFFKFAYSYIESGFPLLLGLPEHVVVSFGHCSDFLKRATYNTSEYMNTLIVNDDNGLPYEKITNDESENQFSYSLSKVDSFVVPLPEKVFLSVDQFEKLADRTLSAVKNHFGVSLPPLKRIFLTTGRSFKKKAFERFGNHPVLRDLYLKFPMPHFIWVCELSSHDVYSKSFHCNGEIIWDATRNALDGNMGLVINLPEIVLFDEGAVHNKDEHYCQIRRVNKDSYDIYTNNLEEI